MWKGRDTPRGSLRCETLNGNRFPGLTFVISLCSPCFSKCERMRRVAPGQGTLRRAQKVNLSSFTAIAIQNQKSIEGFGDSP